MAETVIFGWLRDDGTISFDRDEIIGNVRKVVSKFKNSPGFIERIERQYDTCFQKLNFGQLD